MTGHKIKIGAATIKDGRVTIVTKYRDVTAKIRARKSKRVRVVKRTAP